MSFYNLYVGDASDPKFHWEGGDHSGNIPTIILDLGSIGLVGCMDAMNLLEDSRLGIQWRSPDKGADHRVSERFQRWLRHV